MYGYAHGGFLRCAAKIFQDLERHKYLDLLLGPSQAVSPPLAESLRERLNCLSAAQLSEVGDLNTKSYPVDWLLKDLANLQEVAKREGRRASGGLVLLQGFFDRRKSDGE